MESKEVIEAQKRIVFLFGAGAEGRGNYNLPTGFDYLRESLFTDETSEAIFNALSDFFGKRVFFDNYSYRKDKTSATSSLLSSFLLVRSQSDGNFLEKHSHQIFDLLSDNDYKDLVADNEDNTTILTLKSAYKKEKEARNMDAKEAIKESEKPILSEFQKIMTGNLISHSEIENTLLRDLFPKSKKTENITFDLNVGISGLLDNYFHTIINPVKYGKVRFSRVFNYYWCSYFSIVRAVIKHLQKNKNNRPKISEYLSENEPDANKIISKEPLINSRFTAISW